MTVSVQDILPDEVKLDNLHTGFGEFKHQFQTFATHDPSNGMFGDCMRTCHAMMLGVDKNEIPNWMQVFHEMSREHELNRSLTSVVQATVLLKKSVENIIKPHVESLKWVDADDAGVAPAWTQRMRDFYESHFNVRKRDIGVMADYYPTYVEFVELLLHSGLTDIVPIEICGKSPRGNHNHGIIMYRGVLYDPNPLAERPILDGPLIEDDCKDDIRYWGISLFEKVV